MKKELLNFVSTLTPEQLEKLANHLEELHALCEEQEQPFHLEHS